MSKIENVGIKLSELNNGLFKIASYDLPMDEVLGKDDVLECISYLIGIKLQNTGLQLLEITKDNEMTNNLQSELKMNVHDVIREIAVYYLIGFLDDENISSELIDDEIKFINENFDLVAIITNFSDLPKPKLVPVADTLGGLDSVSLYKINKNVLNGNNTVLEEK